MDVDRVFDRLRHPAARTVTGATVETTAPSALERERYGLLVTYRRSGAAVQTPVWFAEAAGRLYLRSERDTGKVRRIRAGSAACIAPCTFRGRPTGPAIAVRARLMEHGEEHVAEAALADKYGRLRRLYRRAVGPGNGGVYIELAPSAGAGGADA